MPPSALLSVHPELWRRRFAVLSFASMLVLAVIAATLLSHDMARRMLQNHAELSQAYIDSLLQLHGGHIFFTQRNAPETEAIESLFAGLSSMQGLVHANVYNASRRIIWSTNREAVGQEPGINIELDEALKGTLAIESALLDRANFIKPEHAFVPDAARDAIETYIPVRDPRGAVVGVTELYQSPKSLIDAIHAVTREVWLACAGSGVLIFLTLYGFAWQADRQIAEQQRRLVANESLAAVGDMASAVAHGIRNPLAAIRSSAELMSAEASVARDASDIMSEVDRLQAWVRQLLAYAQQGGRALGPVQVSGLVDHLLEQHAPRIERQQVVVLRSGATSLPVIEADASALVHALDNLFSNALDAMPQGGSVTVDCRVERQMLRIEIADDGTGMDAQTLAHVFSPFHTTKRTGLGVGLSLVQRTVHRLGGEIQLFSAVGQGTRAVLRLPIGGVIAGASSEWR